MGKQSSSDARPAAGSDPHGSDDPGASGVTFESSLERLEAIVDRLEQGELPLEGSLEAFEQGVALTRRCAEQLETAERRIELLVREGANWVTRPFEEPEETD
ncbi:MAG: exodeoxyribonuclease VII small subunit [Myxococcota bacterium]